VVYMHYIRKQCMVGSGTDTGTDSFSMVGSVYHVLLHSCSHEHRSTTVHLPQNNGNNNAKV
jgi:hypothetical protein